MNGLAALISKEGEEVSEPLARMLEAMKHRGDYSYGFAGYRGTLISGSLSEAGEVSSWAMLGCCNGRLLPGDLEQPLEQYGYALALDGRIYPPPGTPDALTVAELLGQRPEEGVRRLLEEVNGSYALIVLREDRLICARDPLGVTPLYVGENERWVAVASERKALWSIGIASPRSLPPGHVAEVSRKDVVLRPVRVLTPPEVRRMGMEEAVGRLGELLYRAVDVRTRGLDRVAVGFSGGLDSSLLAHLVDECGVGVDLISVGVEGSGDIEEAVEGAEAIGLPYHVEVHGEEEVEETLEEALLCVEEPDPMKVGVAIPLLWVAERTMGLGDRVLLLGQGCDELFGGYWRHLREYLQRGAEAAQGLIFRDVSGAYERNYERDNKVSARHGVELRLPFADWDLTQFALSLPIELKLPREEGLPRKRVLRALAERVGLPSRIVKRRKKAIQYSTGVEKALRRIARRRGLSLRGFLEKRFREALSARGFDAVVGCV